MIGRDAKFVSSLSYQVLFDNIILIDTACDWSPTIQAYMSVGEY